MSFLNLDSMIGKEFCHVNWKNRRKILFSKNNSQFIFGRKLHEANAVICNEAAEAESVFLESSETRNGHIVLLYRLLRRENGKKITKVVKSRK